jgi:hypothetical protein
MNFFQKGIVEAALTGADSIWAVLPRDVHPYIRKNFFGDYIKDPIHHLQKKQKLRALKGKPRKYTAPIKRMKVRRIPIFYISTTIKDFNVRDSYAYGPLTGARYVRNALLTFSEYALPALFAAVWPYTLMSYSDHINFRSSLRSGSAFYRTEGTFNGESIRDGQFLPFTFRESDVKPLLEHVRNSVTRLSRTRDFLGTTTEDVKREGRFLTPDQIYNILPEPDKTFELEKFRQITRFSDLMTYYKTDEAEAEFLDEHFPKTLFKARYYEPVGKQNKYRTNNDPSTPYKPKNLKQDL